MNKKQINIFEYSCLLVILITSFLSTTVINEMINITFNRTCMSIIIASLLGLLLMYTYFSIQKRYSNLNIIEIQREVFGKVIGTILNILLITTVSILSAYLLYSFSSFIKAEFLQETPIIFISVIVAFITTYVVKLGIEGYFRGITFLLSASMFIILVALVFLLPKVHLSEVLVNLNVGAKDIIKSVLTYLIIIITPLFTMLLLKKNDVKDYGTKKLYIAYGIANLFIVLIIFLGTTILGNSLIKQTMYPQVNLLSEISAFRQFGRIDNLISLLFIVFILLAIIYLMIFVYRSSVSLFKSKKEVFVLIPLFLMLLISYLFTYENIYKLVTDNYMYLSIVSFIVVPIYILFFGKKTDDNNKDSVQNN